MKDGYIVMYTHGPWSDKKAPRKAWEMVTGQTWCSDTECAARQTAEVIENNCRDVETRIFKIALCPDNRDEDGI